MIEKEKFTMGVSTRNYPEKPNFSLVEYQNKEITQNKFITLIQDGYSFCHCMKNNDIYGQKDKTISNFTHTNFIWFDFDNSTTTFNEVWDNIEDKPSIGYTTISNTSDLNRFRLIYLTDFDIKTNDDYKNYINLLYNQLNNNLGGDVTKSIDDSCFNVAQQMFGSREGCSIKSSNIIYSQQYFNDFKSANKIIDYLKLGKRCSKKLNLYNKKEEKERVTQNEQITTKELIRLLNEFDVKSFTPITTNKNHAVLSEDVYTNVEEQNIYEIYFHYSNNKNGYEKIKKGKRNKTLFTFGIIIRNIQPDISITGLAKNLYWYYIHRFEQSDDFTRNEICKIAMDVYDTDLTNYADTGKRKYIIRDDCKHLSRPEKCKMLGKARKKKQDEVVLNCYDTNRTIDENAKEIGCCTNTVRRVLSDNNITIPASNKEKYNNFCKVFEEHPTASVRELMKLCKLSDKTIQRYKKRYVEENAEKIL